MNRLIVWSIVVCVLLGSSAGDVLAVTLLDIEPGRWGETLITSIAFDGVGPWKCELSCRIP